MSQPRSTALTPAEVIVIANRRALELWLLREFSANSIHTSTDVQARTKLTQFLRKLATQAGELHVKKFLKESVGINKYPSPLLITARHDQLVDDGSKIYTLKSV